MRFRFDDITGFRRIVDFKDRASDTGPYVLSGNANFYNIMTGVNPIYAQNQLALSLFTRDASGTFSAYVGGVLQYTLSDVGNLATVAVNTVRFFQDDTAVGGEASAGLVNYIATWNRALTAEQVRLFDPTGGNTIVPEPATFALFAAGLLCVAAAKRRYWFNA